MKRVGNGAGLVVALAVAGLALAACGGSVNEAASSSAPAPESSAAPAESSEAPAPAPADCGEWGVAMHAWVGYTASAQVLSDVAREKLGCTINQVQLDEAGVTYDAMEAGSVDV
ncbi:MAG: hypothetical protein FGM36_16350, partial [Burkholderiaceae bacterium]|nr:hypothetical protein [Burkholderiaceae bacterium]